jgi:hypothetical protein
MVKKPRKGQPRGRSGGRAGGAGYDFQDLYIALQLAKLLVGDHDTPSLLALSGRASEAGDIAKRLNLLAFVDLIGPSTGIEVTP